MKILVVGGGGREHALCWAITASPLVENLYCAPGNAGINAVAECVPIGEDDVDGLVAFAVERAIDAIYAGDIFQVNLSQQLYFPARMPSVELYRRLRKRNPATFAAYFSPAGAPRNTFATIST